MHFHENISPSKVAWKNTAVIFPCLDFNYNNISSMSIKEIYAFNLQISSGTKPVFELLVNPLGKHLTSNAQVNWQSFISSVQSITSHVSIASRVSPSITAVFWYSSAKGALHSFPLVWIIFIACTSLRIQEAGMNTIHNKIVCASWYPQSFTEKVIN